MLLLLDKWTKMAEAREKFRSEVKGIRPRGLWTEETVAHTGFK